MLKNRTTKEMTTIIAIREKRNGGDVLAYDDTYLTERGTIDVARMADNGEFGDNTSSDDIEDAEVTSFEEDLIHYEVVEFNSEDEIVDEFNKLGVSEKIGERFLKWFYNGDETIEFGYHDGSEYMEWYVRADDVEDDDE